MKKAAEYLATNISKSDKPIAFAGGIIFYFSILGFLAWYILTRVRLKRLFKKFERADIDEIRSSQQALQKEQQALKEQ